MNTKYELGNVIRDTADFSRWEFPAELPTEEWKGDEARSYTNYIRPVANLFENDRENETFVKDLYKSLLYNIGRNSVISGCNVVKTTISNHDYYEVQHGAFINTNKIYYVYPACEAAAKQIEKEFVDAGNPYEIRLKISYNSNNNTYSYEYYDLSSVKHYETSINTAVELISKLLLALDIDATIESHIVLPIIKKDSGVSYIYFNGTAFTADGTPEGNATVIATVSGNTITPSSTVATINGARIEQGSISNTQIGNNTITIGNTVMHLGDTQTDFAGINSINGVQLRIDQDNAIHVYYRVGASESKAIIADSDYRLASACTLNYTTDIANALDNTLPTTGSVKNYISNFVNSTPFTSAISFNNGIITTALNSSGQIKSTSTVNASLSNDNLSGAASIYTKGGVEVEKNIYCKGEIVGISAGTYSSRAYKENITPFTESAVDLINTIDIVNYTYKADNEHNHKIGFIADDTHEYFATKAHNIMDQSNCIGLLLRAVQELSAENKELRKEINELKSNLS